MECQTIKYVKKDGTPVIVNKVKYKTLADAVKNAESINRNKKIFIKRVPYKCSECDFFHVGSSEEMLNNKKLPKAKWLGPRHVKFNVVGSIDLTQFKPKEKKLSKIPITKDFLHSTYVFQGKLWKMISKKKIMIITLPDGRIRKPSLIKIYGDDVNLSGFVPDRNRIRLFINDNHEKLMRK